MGKLSSSTPPPEKFRDRAKEARRTQVREDILEAAKALVLDGGVSALTMNAVASRLGVTKPAVYYYFKNRDALVSAMAVAVLEAEAVAMEAAARGAGSAVEAVRAVVRACVEHHREHLDSFRLMYAIGQVMPERKDTLPRESIPTITSRIYGALEERLREGQARGEIDPNLDPRATAVSLHAAALGLATLHSVTNGKGDPLRHSMDTLLDALLIPLSRGLTPPA